MTEQTRTKVNAKVAAAKEATDTIDCLLARMESIIKDAERAIRRSREGNP